VSIAKTCHQQIDTARYDAMASELIRESSHMKNPTASLRELTQWHPA